MPRAAWKGPFFVAFPGLKQAVQAGTPIATQGLYERHLQYIHLFSNPPQTNSS